MTLVFYPHSDDMRKGSLTEKIEILNEAAERYKAMILAVTNNNAHKITDNIESDGKKYHVPREQTCAYNWEEIARILYRVRNLPEVEKEAKLKKANLLIKLAEVYEILRAAKMPKLEAVRLSLMSEAMQLRSGDTHAGS
ncbi:MAG TPA: hypothetical protein VHZ76_02585 [Gammaproteobacteria bacterium]|jgi:hypothetical protein|nr:hypothetical protein [Gammaproteobacteria bacterium]